MRKEPNKKLIGAFMLSGLAVLLVVFGIFFKERIFPDKGKILVMYFEESINGLNVGAPVVFKGVQIGKVTAIDLLANAENLEFSIPVYVKMEQRKNIEDSEFASGPAVLDELIKKGLRARLTTQSYLTGLLMIELELLPDTPVILHHTRNNPNILEIPTVLSPLGKFSKGVQDLPLRASVLEFNKFFQTLNAELPATLAQLKEASASLNKILSNNRGATSETLNNFNRTLNSVSEAARSMRNLTDYLERHPEALLKGKEGGY